MVTTSPSTSPMAADEVPDLTLATDWCEER